MDSTIYQKKNLNSPASGTNYSLYTVKDLKTELKRRNLATKGVKADLVSDMWAVVIVKQSEDANLRVILC